MINCYCGGCGLSIRRINKIKAAGKNQAAFKMQLKKMQKHKYSASD